MGKMDEKILVVPRYYLFEDEELTFHGLLTDEASVKRIMKKFDKYREIRRGDAENNDKLKQPIPSVIIKRGEEVFVYKRLHGGGEVRLHDQLSITVGGHMNRVNDVHNWETNLIMNLQRELNEEVELRVDNGEMHTIDLIGLINDDRNDVGLHHIGILYSIDLPEGADVSVRETEQLEGYWIRSKDLIKSPLFESLETWSQFVVEAGVLW